MVLMVFILPVICGDDDSKGNSFGPLVYFCIIFEKSSSSLLSFIQVAGIFVKSGKI